MKLLVVRKKHNCIICGGELRIGALALRVYVASGTFIRAKYYCPSCGGKELTGILKQIEER